MTGITYSKSGNHRLMPQKVNYIYKVLEKIALQKSSVNLIEMAIFSKNMPPSCRK